MGQKEGMERAGRRRDFGTRTCFARQGKRQYLTASVVDGEHQRCARWRSMPDTCLPCASPYPLQHHLAACFPIRRLSLAKPARIVAQESRHTAFQAENG
jgi:hypothetical protein